jgi:hypothetical protein
VQRIAYADNETNYCATCQTGGGSWQIARSHVSSSRTGRERSRSWRSGFRPAGAE